MVAKEILSIPEENLEEVIKVIRIGLEHILSKDIDPLTFAQLVQWCDQEEEYLKDIKSS